MKKTINGLFCGLLIAAIAFLFALIALTLTLQRVVAVLPAEIAETRRAALAEIDRQATAIRTDATEQIVALRGDTMPRLDRLTALVDRRSGEALSALDGRSGEVTAAVTGIRQDLAPLLANAATVTASPDVVGVLRDTRFLMARSARAAGHVEQAADAVEDSAKNFEGALPSALLTWQGIGDHVSVATAEAATASQATALTMRNFAAASKPLPTWARIALGVGPPVVEAGAAAVSAGILLRWIK